MLTTKQSRFFYPACLILALSAAACNDAAKTEDTTAATDSTTTPAAGADFVQIFDGKTLTGWEGDTAYWRAENGVLVGEITPDKTLKTNSFITWKGGETKDFELVADFNITETGNSGVNYRSEVVKDVPFALKGYQADIDGKNVYTGQNYEERGRTIVAFRGQNVTLLATDTGKSVGNIWNAAKQNPSLGSSDSLKSLIKSNDWNEIRIVAKGNNLKHYINGTLMSEVTDEDKVNGKASGLLGFQVHVGPPMKVQYRNIRLKTL